MFDKKAKGLAALNTLTSFPIESSWYWRDIVKKGRRLFSCTYVLLHLKSVLMFDQVKRRRVRGIYFAEQK